MKWPLYLKWSFWPLLVLWHNVMMSGSPYCLYLMLYYQDTHIPTCRWRDTHSCWLQTLIRCLTFPQIYACNYIDCALDCECSHKAQMQCCCWAEPAWISMEYCSCTADTLPLQQKAQETRSKCWPEVCMLTGSMHVLPWGSLMLPPPQCTVVLMCCAIAFKTHSGYVQLIREKKTSIK